MTPSNYQFQLGSCVCPTSPAQCPCPTNCGTLRLPKTDLVLTLTGEVWTCPPGYQGAFLPGVKGSGSPYVYSTPLPYYPGQLGSAEAWQSGCLADGPFFQGADPAGGPVGWSAFLLQCESGAMRLRGGTWTSSDRPRCPELYQPGLDGAASLQTYTLVTASSSPLSLKFSSPADNQDPPATAYGLCTQPQQPPAPTPSLWPAFRFYTLQVALGPNPRGGTCTTFCVHNPCPGPAQLPVVRAKITLKYAGDTLRLTTGSDGCCQTTEIIKRATYAIDIKEPGGGQLISRSQFVVPCGTYGFSPYTCMRICLTACGVPYSCTKAIVTLENVTTDAEIVSGEIDQATGCVDLTFRDYDALPNDPTTGAMRVAVRVKTDSQVWEQESGPLPILNPLAGSGVGVNAFAIQLIPAQTGAYWGWPTPSTGSVCGFGSQYSCGDQVWPVGGPSGCWPGGASPNISPPPIPSALTLTDANGSWDFKVCFQTGGINTPLTWRCCYGANVSYEVLEYDDRCGYAPGSGVVPIIYVGYPTCDLETGVYTFTVQRLWPLANYGRWLYGGAGRYDGQVNPCGSYSSIVDHSSGCAALGFDTLCICHDPIASNNTSSQLGSAVGCGAVAPCEQFSLSLDMTPNQDPIFGRAVPADPVGGGVTLS